MHEARTCNGDAADDGDDREQDDQHREAPAAVTRPVTTMPARRVVLFVAQAKVEVVGHYRSSTGTISPTGASVRRSVSSADWSRTTAAAASTTPRADLELRPAARRPRAASTVVNRSSSSRTGTGLTARASWIA
jgi:hypothetical protein